MNPSFFGALKDPGHMMLHISSPAMRLCVQMWIIPTMWIGTMNLYGFFAGPMQQPLFKGILFCGNLSLNTHSFILVST